MNRLRADATAGDVAAAIRAELTKMLDTAPEGRNAFEGFSTRRGTAIYAKTRAFDKFAIHPLALGVLDSALETEKETAQ